MIKTIATFLLTSLLICAQGPGAPRTPPDPATIAKRQVDFLTMRLSLTTAQQAQALTIFTPAATAEAATQADLRTARQSLHAAVLSNSTGAITNLATQIGILTTTLTSSQAMAEAAFRQILTADQQAKYGQGPGHGRGFGGGPRPQRQ